MTPTALRKPYIVPYDEQVARLPLGFGWSDAAAGLRLTYADAIPEDWMFGVLWARLSTAPGKKIMWKLVHTLYQRRCMLRNLCQVCGESAVDPASKRIWWLLSAPPDNPVAGYTNAPPTCRQHIPEALQSCPHLRKGSPAVYTAGASEPYGVVADVFNPDDNLDAVLVEKGVTIRLEEFRRLELALAKQLLVTMWDLRPEPIPIP